MLDHLPSARHHSLAQLGRLQIFVLAIVAAILLTVGSAVNAISKGTVELDSVAGDGWVATGVTLEMNLLAEPIQAHARIARITVAALGAQSERAMRDLRIDCPNLKLDGSLIRCADAHVSGHFPGLVSQRLRGQLQYDRGTGGVEFALSGIRLAEGDAQISGEWQSGLWNTRVTLRKTQADKLIGWAKQWIADPPEATAAGELNLELLAQGRDATLTRIDWQLQTRKFTVNNSTGTLATDKLELSSSGNLSRVDVKNAAPSWRFAGSLQTNGGQAYAEPVFLSFEKNPAEISLRGEWRASAISLEQFAIKHAGALSATGKALFSLKDTLVVDQLHLEIQHAELPAAYTQYLQPFFIGTAFGSLKTNGTATGAIDVAANAPINLSIALHDIAATEAQGRWSIDGLNGTVDWRKQPAMAEQAISHLQWQHAQLLGLDVGSAALRFTANDRNFAITQATRIPFLDGHIELAALQVKQAGQPNMALQMDATLTPISVQRLCKAFGWPEFGGRLGGRLSNLQLRDGVVTLGTTLRANVFDGSVSIDDLRLEQALSKWPRLAADIAIDNVDLEQVTTAFSFGRITGRLSGTIDDLRLFNWLPVSFDASLYTPANDRSRHRISQRAVESIGKLGGSGSGITAALSSGLLKFFDDFNYERLGISCRLANDVCTMNGVEPASTGYYLVKGRGLPRIDVIGNSQRVAWSRLVAQLQAATRSQGPIVTGPVNDPEKAAGGK